MAWPLCDHDREEVMGILTEIVRNVLVIVLVAGFLEMLLPEGNTRPLVRLCIGMFILIAVLNPILGFFFSGKDFEIGSWDYQPGEVQPLIDIQAEGNRVHEALVDQSKAVARQKLQEQINAVAVLVPGVQKVESQVELDDNGRVKKVILAVELEKKAAAGKSEKEEAGGGSDEAATKAKITELMHNLYGFEENAVKIEFEGG